VRDFHWADWVRKTLEDSEERDLERTLAFHHCGGPFALRVKRNFNVLSYEYQEQIAPRRLQRVASRRTAQTMMRDYFLRASQMHGALQCGRRKSGGAGTGLRSNPISATPSR
jgi:hypothetical protein